MVETVRVENPFVAVLRISAFRNLWLSQVFSQVFLNVLIFSLVIRIYELTEKNTAVALMVLMATIPNFLFGAIAGVLADRWDRKMVMFLSHFLRVFAVLAFLLSSESLIWLYILTFLTSLITQFFQPAEAAMIGVVVPDKEKLLTANSLFSITFFSSVVVGNVLSGPSLKFLGSDGTFLLVACAFGLASIFTAKVPGGSIRNWFRAMIIRPVIKLPITRKELGRQSLSEGLLEGLDYLYHNAHVRYAVYLMVIGQIVIQTLGAVATGFAHKVLLLDASDVSVMVMAPAALGMIIGAVLIGQHFARVSRQKMIKGSIVAIAAILLVFAFVDKVAAVGQLPLILSSGVVLVLLGISNAFLDIPINTVVQEGTPISVRSRVYGVTGTLIGAASVVPILLAGTIGDLFGVRIVIVVLAIFLLGLAVYYSRKRF